MTDKKTLLANYKKVWDKIDEISKRTDNILKVSAMGQAPPVFHQLVEKQVIIIDGEAKPIWEQLKHCIRKDWQTYWQYTGGSMATMPPHFNELGEIV